ncbi:glutamine amidotransferase [Paludibacterium denitrificans]|uniref:Glutamine amidotransferase n=1 Tax=Paludibacterium denitrificans TaxID=2675226 RepID=A0A844GEK0_9NEIS|nr:glutamine amidotransferase [Paludibacterium denitrificans]MTD32975.1 glutamine amidotransferase [Paludibacterium denitrificans]
MKYKLIIKTGVPVADVAAEYGLFEDWIARELGDTAADWQVVDVQHGAELPAVAEVAAAIITGSAAMVSERAAWSEATADWLRCAHAAEVPLLGICYGHQLLAHALGGEVSYHPQGPEVGVVTVQRLPAAQDDQLLGALPAQFPAAVIHWQSVLALPPGAVRLAENSFEPNHAFRCGSARGVQFHPEFNDTVMGSYLQRLAEKLSQEGLDPSALQQQLRPTPEANRLLWRFGQLAG